MKTLLTLLFAVMTASLFGQTKKLTSDEVSAFYTSAKRTELGIEYPIFRVYEYSDKEGKHHIVLAEKVNQKGGKEPAAVQGFHFKISGSNATEVWKMKDAKSKDNGVSEEYGMWFWTKYFDIKDIDGDGLVDPIMIYGSKGMNGYDDGRIKILVYYKGKKIGIRHQNGTLDNERNTKVDAEFYALPSSIQTHVKNVMDAMVEKSHAIFPAGWKDAMKAKKTAFDEN